MSKKKKSEVVKPTSFLLPEGCALVSRGIDLVGPRVVTAKNFKGGEKEMLYHYENGFLKEV